MDSSARATLDDLTLRGRNRAIQNAKRKFSDLAHRIRHYQDDLAKQAKELSELKSELARLKQIMGTVREALRCIDTYSYKGGMTSDAEKKAHAQLAEFMTKGF